MMNLIRSCDPKIYGIDWDANDDPKKSKPSGPIIRAKPICEYKGCGKFVSTSHNKAKPYCRDHVFENLYVKDVLRRYKELDNREDRRLTAERWETMKEINNEQHNQ